MRNKRPRVLASLYPTIDGFLAYDVEQLDRMWALYDETNALLEANSELIPDGITFLNGRLHDSWLISVQRHSDEIVFTINEFMTHCFCEAYNALRQRYVPHKKVITRIELRFSGSVSMGVSRVNGNGCLLPVNIERYLPYFEDLLTDDVRRLDENGIEMGFHFCNSRAHQSDLVVEVKAKRLSIKEYLKEDSIAICGAEIEPFFDAYRQARRDTNECFDYSSSQDFLKRLGIPDNQ